MNNLIIKKSIKILSTLVLIIILFSCSSEKNNNSKFSFEKNNEGIELKENENPVLFYQTNTKSLNGEFPRNNYIHPLYGLNGEILTEDFPEDHPHHRGVFWAWHQIYHTDSSLGDGWALENFENIIKDVSTKTNKNSAIINIDAVWISPIFENNKPYLSEQASVKVNEITDSIRIIDFEIKLQALVDEIKIGGSNDAKGYGGFSLRIKMPDDLTFISDSEKVIPEELQIEAGPWMNFSAKFDNENLSGLTLFCHPSTPGYIQNWILRQNRSMQNIVFPGSELVPILKDEPTVLHYRLILHKGESSKSEIEKWENDYNKISFKDTE